MRINPRMAVVAIASLVAPLLVTQADATIRKQTATIATLSIASTIGNIPEVVDIVLAQPLTVATCPGGTRGFEFDSKSVTDAATRRNMVSILLSAKLAGVAVTIVYDDASTVCSSNGFTVPYAISLN